MNADETQAVPSPPARPETKSIIVTQAVQDYAVAHSTNPPDAVQRSLIEATHALGGISMMQISPDQGAFMTLLTRLVGARWACRVVIVPRAAHAPEAARLVATAGHGAPS